ncbi:MAG: rRNA maturation RNase YbeY [Clostridia bacterium]|nr:rRNA maturation RNase YbeY [Clostridia bacterium]
MSLKEKLSYLRFYRFGRLKMDIACLCEQAQADKQLSSLIKKAISATLAYEGVKSKCYVSVQLCDPSYIKELNATYRQKDSETDVLSFPLYEKEDLPQKGMAELGDIVISCARAEAQAKELGHSYHREVAFLAIHSTLHLLGYDHEKSQEDDEDMCRRQKDVISRLFIK